jgi:hypothetical protein
LHDMVMCQRQPPLTLWNDCRSLAKSDPLKAPTFTRLGDLFTRKLTTFSRNAFD